MQTCRNIQHPLGDSFNTLADNGTSILPIVAINGTGTDIIDNPALENRAKRKIITNKMVLSLVDVARDSNDYDAVKQYWNAYHCQSNIIGYQHKLYGKYCKNRFCTICTAIRKADIINRYYPVISMWDEPHFVTLTVKSCKAEKLKEWIWRMFRAFELIHNRCKKRHQRGKGIKLIGVKSLECNFNPVKKTYNPHFHIIVPDRATALLLKEEWLKQWRPIRNGQGYYNRYKYTTPKAQDIKRVDDLEHTLIETIKYGSKIFTEPDLKKKAKRPKDHKIYAKALHNIFQAIKGKRLFERFGFNRPPKDNPTSCKQWIQDYEEWVYSIQSADWVNKRSKEPLTGYLMPSELTQLLNECIDNESQ